MPPARPGGCAWFVPAAAPPPRYRAFSRGNTPALTMGGSDQFASYLPGQCAPQIPLWCENCGLSFSRTARGWPPVKIINGYAPRTTHQLAATCRIGDSAAQPHLHHAAHRIGSPVCPRDDQHLFHKSQSDDPASVAMDVSNDRLDIRCLGRGDGRDLDRIAPRGGRVATMALNIVLLLVFPLGTALGIYGLLKVDKGGPPAEA